MHYNVGNLLNNHFFRYIEKQKKSFQKLMGGVRKKSDRHSKIKMNLHLEGNYIVSIFNNVSYYILYPKQHYCAVEKYILPYTVIVY